MSFTVGPNGAGKSSPSHRSSTHGTTRRTLSHHTSNGSEEEGGGGSFILQRHESNEGTPKLSDLDMETSFKVMNELLLQLSNTQKHALLIEALDVCGPAVLQGLGTARDAILHAAFLSEPGLLGSVQSMLEDEEGGGDGEDGEEGEDGEGALTSPGSVSSAAFAAAAADLEEYDDDDDEEEDDEDDEAHAVDDIDSHGKGGGGGGKGKKHHHQASTPTNRRGSITGTLQGWYKNITGAKGGEGGEGGGKEGQ